MTILGSHHSNNNNKAVEPLRDLLGEVLLRLEALESKVGITTGTASTTTTTTTHPTVHPYHHQHPLSSGSNHTTKGTMRLFYSI